MNLSFKNENYTYSSLTLSLESRQYLSQEYFTAISLPTICKLADYWDIDPIFSNIIYEKNVSRVRK
jgi:hypothetical protein